MKYLKRFEIFESINNESDYYEYIGNIFPANTGIGLDNDELSKRYKTISDLGLEKIDDNFKDYIKENALKVFNDWEIDFQIEDFSKDTRFNVKLDNLYTSLTNKNYNVCVFFYIKNCKDDYIILHCYPCVVLKRYKNLTVSTVTPIRRVDLDLESTQTYLVDNQDNIGLIKFLTMYKSRLYKMNSELIYQKINSPYTDYIEYEYIEDLYYR